MELLLRAKHWQIFIILMFANGIFSKIFSLLFNGELAEDIEYIFNCLFLIGWFVLIGIQLKRKIKTKLPILFALFLISATIIISIVVIFRLSFSNDELILMQGESHFFFSYFFLILFLVFNLAIFPAKALRIAEIGDDIDINDYFGDIFKLLFWPIGIWYIQPRLNKIAAQLPE